MRNSLLWSSFALGLLACSHQSKPQTVTAAPPVADTAPTNTPKCGVMQSPGTNVVTSDTSDGVAIVFTTTGDVSDLRAQIRQIADQHNDGLGMRSDQDQSAGVPDTTGGAVVPGATRDNDTDSNSHSATVGGDVHAGIKDKKATVGGDVHGGVGGHTAGVGGDVNAGVKDKGATVGAGVRGSVDDHSANAGADVHGGVKDSGVAAGADVHGGVTSPSGITPGGVNGPTGVNNPSSVNNPAVTGGLQSSSDMMIPARARVEDVPGGERLVLVPQDPSQLPALREQAREQVSMLEKGECPRLMTDPQLQPTGDQAGRHPTGT